MKFGLVMAVRNHPDRPRPLNDIYMEHLSDAVYAEEHLGFDHVWTNEQHLSRDEWCPSPFPYLGYLAARTSKIRIGPSIVPLPYHHPIRVSEDAAVLDILSGGRLDLAVGVGSSDREFETFGTNRAEAWSRAFEAASIIERTFTERSFDFEGRFHSYTNLTQTTKPLQDRVPIWWGGQGPKSMTRAARRGYNLIAAISTEAYDQELVAQGRNPVDFEVAQLVGVHVAETRDQAWDEAQYGVHWWMNFHREVTGVPTGWSSGGPLESLPGPEDLRSYPDLCFLPGIPICVGTPDQVRDQLLESYSGKAARFTQLAIAFRHAGMGTPEVRRSMRLFKDEVMPRLPSAGGVGLVRD